MVAKTAERPVQKAAEKVGAAQTKTPTDGSESDRSLEHLRMIQALNRKIGAKRSELAEAEGRAENAKKTVKGIEADLERLYDELCGVIDDPYKGMELFKQKGTRAEQAVPSRYIVSLFAKTKLIASYNVKAHWPNQAREFCERKHANEWTRAEVREFTTGDESLKLTELDATIDPAWRDRPLADLKLAGGIIAKLPASCTTMESLVRAYLTDQLDESICDEIKGALRKFGDSLADAQRADYVEFAASLPVDSKERTSDADKAPVRKDRATALDHEIAEGVREVEENRNLNRVAYVRERFAAWSPEERLRGMQQALTDHGQGVWAETSLTEIELSDDVHGKLDELEVSTVGDVLNAIADGDTLTKLKGINKTTATAISETLKLDWENLVENHPECAIFGDGAPAENAEPQTAAS